MMLTALTAAIGFVSVKIPGISLRISVAETLACTSLVLFGPAAGALTAAVDGIMGSLRFKNKARRLEYLLFNTGCMAASAFAAGHVFSFLIGGFLQAQSPEEPVADMLLPLGLMALVFYLINSLTVAIVVGLEKSIDVLTVWRSSLGWVSIHYFTAASMAGLLARTAGTELAVKLLALFVASLVLYAHTRCYVESMSSKAHT
jgi:hypothetical protein